jgi:hypothetical protein
MAANSKRCVLGQSNSGKIDRGHRFLQFERTARRLPGVVRRFA